MRATDRGRISLWYVVIAFAVLVLAWSLITVAADVFSSVASAPAYYEVAAIAFALLIATAGVASALGLKYVLS